MIVPKELHYSDDEDNEIDNEFYIDEVNDE